MVKCLAQRDTRAATGQAEIRTHIPIAPELESNALDRSATTLHIEDDPLKHIIYTSATVILLGPVMRAHLWGINFSQ